MKSHRLRIAVLLSAAGLAALAFSWPRPAETRGTKRVAESVSARIPPVPVPVPRPGPGLATEFEKAAGEEDSPERSRGLEALLRDWAAQDAPGAAAFVLMLEDESLRRACLLRVMQSWGARDTEAALAWAEKAGFESAYEREMMMSMACSTLARTDPRAALELGLAHGLGDFANGVLGALVEQWAEADLMTASAWVEAQAEGARRDALVESIALVVQEVDPVQAARWVTRQMPPGEGRDRTLETLLAKLAGQDPQAASEWAGSFFGAAARERFLERIERMRGK